MALKARWTTYEEVQVYFQPDLSPEPDQPGRGTPGRLEVVGGVETVGTRTRHQPRLTLVGGFGKRCPPHPTFPGTYATTCL